MSHKLRKFISLTLIFLIVGLPLKSLAIDLSVIDIAPIAISTTDINKAQTNISQKTAHCHNMGLDQFDNDSQKDRNQCDDISNCNNNCSSSSLALLQTTPLVSNTLLTATLKHFNHMLTQQSSIVLLRPPRV